MPRSVELSVPADLTDSLLSQLEELDGVITLRMQRGISVRPPGDVITLEVIDRSLHPLARLLVETGLLRQGGGSVTTSQPLSVVSLPTYDQIANDSSEATWEEMDLEMGRESNMTLNSLVVMGISGVVATVGLAENALHLVVGAMLMAPGFQPIVRAILGVISRGRRWRTAVLQLAQAYGALMLAALLSATVLNVLGRDPAGASGTYLPPGVLVAYWSSISPVSLAVALLAGVAGTILIATNRAVLTAGVMVALALVPGAALIGIGAATGDLTMAARGAARWLIEVALVAVGASAVLVLKRQALHRRDTLST